MGILFALIAYNYFDLLLLGNSQSFIIIFGFYAIIACLAVVIAVYDMRHMIIPNAFVYAWAILGLIPQTIAFTALGVTQISVLDLLAGPILFVFFWALWFFSKGSWMGFGDAKLALAMGLVLGLSRGLTAVVMGFWIGALYGILLMLCKKAGMKSEVPFGPFLIIGFFLALFLNFDIMHLYDSF